jgi:hypothetical protein
LAKGKKPFFGFFLDPWLSPPPHFWNGGPPTVTAGRRPAITRGLALSAYLKQNIFIHQQSFMTDSSPSNHENTPRAWVKVKVTKPVSVMG